MIAMVVRGRDRTVPTASSASADSVALNARMADGLREPSVVSLTEGNTNPVPTAPQRNAAGSNCP